MITIISNAVIAPPSSSIVFSPQDMASDIYMIYYFRINDQKMFANANLAMIITNIVIQICLVLSSTSKMKTSTKIKEVLYVALCIKPGVDALRVAIDWESDEQQTLEPLQEMVL